MTWREAYLQQEKSDFAFFQKLNMSNAAKCHQLHFLQMSSEKLAKAYLCSPQENEPYRATHHVLVSFLRTLKLRRDISRLLGYDTKNPHFINYINNLLSVAEKVQNLAPVGSDFSKVNAEYPWRSARNGLTVPCQFDYDEFYIDDKLNFQRFLDLIAKLLEIAPQV